MRVAGHTYAYRDRPLEEALDELAGLGLRFVEVWLGHAKRGPERVARLLAERRLEAVAVSAGGFYTRETPASATSFELALSVGAPVVVACVSPAVLSSISKAIPAGVALCVENHWDQALATPRTVNRALAREPGLRACLDTGHGILAAVPPERFAASLGSRLGHVHLKDARPPTPLERLLGRRLRRRLLPRPEPVFPGRGALTIERLSRALNQVGYRGAITLEHEGQEPTAALAELLRSWRSVRDDDRQSPD